MGANIGGIPIRFKCVRCTKKITTLRKYAGKTGRCPTCRQQQQIPDRISFVCLCCHGRLRVKGKWAGRKVRCPKCREPLRVPGERRREPSRAELELFESSAEPLPAEPQQEAPRVFEGGFTPFESSSADVAVVLSSETDLPEHQPAAEADAVAAPRRTKRVVAAALIAGAVVPVAGVFAAPRVKALLQPGVDAQVAAVSAAVDAEDEPSATATPAPPNQPAETPPAAPPAPPEPPAVKQDQGPDLWTGDPLKTLEALLVRHINRENRFRQLAVRIAAAEYRFIHAGKTAEDHNAAAKKLAAWAKAKGRQDTWGFLTGVRPSLAQDAFAGAPAWAGDDRIAKLKVLVEHQRGGALADELIAEHLVAEAQGLPLDKRAAAWLKALEELVLAGLDHRDTKTYPILSSYFTAAALELYRFDAEVSALTPVQKLHHLRALSERVTKLEPSRAGRSLWSQTLTRHLAREALLADPAFEKGPEARQEVIDGFVRTKAISKWDARDLVRQYVKLKPGGSEIQDALLALARAPGYAGATAAKQAEIAKAFYEKSSRRFYRFGRQIRTYRRTLNMNLLAAEHDLSKPLAPADELAFWQKVRKQYGAALLGNEGNIRWNLARVALLNADPSYVKASPLEKAARIHKLKPVEWSSAGAVKRALVAFAGDQAAVGLPLAKRGWARLGECAKARRLGLRPDAALHAVVAHLVHSDAFRGGTAKERLAYLAQMEQQQRIDWSLRRTIELPYAVAMLESDGAFQAADAAGKRKVIEELDRPGKLITPFSVGDLKKRFGL